MISFESPMAFMPYLVWINAALLIIFVFNILLIANSKRSFKRRLAAIAINAMLITSISLLIYRPSIEQPIQELTLITPGTSLQTIKSLMNNNHDLKTIYFDQSLINDATDNSLAKFLDHKQFQSFSTLNDIDGINSSKINIYGSGLMPYQISNQYPDIQRFDNDTMIHSESLINTIDWTRRLQLGEPLSITGNATVSDSQTLVVYDPLGIKQVVSLSDTGDFSANLWPKASGTYLYELQIIDDAKVVASSRLPVIVNKPISSSVLLIADAPGFEVAQLQRFLEAQNIQLASRLRISKDKYKFSFHQLDTLNLQSLNDLNYNNFDLVIMDQRSLVSLSDSELLTLSDAISTDGLGLLIISHPSELATTSAVDQTTPFISSSDWLNRQVLSKPSLSLWQLNKGIPDPQSSNSLKAYADFTANASLVSTYTFGQGKVSVSIINETYRWWMSEQQDIYSDFWRTLFKATAMAEKVADKIFVERNLNIVGEPTNICKTNGQSNTAKVTYPSGLSYELEVYQSSETLHCFKLLPVESGWLSIEFDNLNEWHHVFKKEEWQTARTNIRHKTTGGLYSSQAAKDAVNHQVPLNINWLLILIFIGFALSFIEQKF